MEEEKVVLAEPGRETQDDVPLRLESLVSWLLNRHGRVASEVIDSLHVGR